MGGQGKKSRPNEEQGLWGLETRGFVPVEGAQLRGGKKNVNHARCLAEVKGGGLGSCKRREGKELSGIKTTPAGGGKKGEFKKVWEKNKEGGNR